MADHKIDGNDGAGNVRAVDIDALVYRFWSIHPKEVKALVERLDNPWAADDGIEKGAAPLWCGQYMQEAKHALTAALDEIERLRKKNATLHTSNGGEPAPAVTVQEAARVLLGVFEDPDANAPHGFDWQSMYDEMTADHKESLDICGTHDWPSTLIVALRAIAPPEA